ncbi:TPA: hypothetical protein HA244_05010 [Candidatus Micrarchaeota archaeon]|nr:hypothetical protein [Candidatus Micrarchaeota archaeon]
MFTRLALSDALKDAKYHLPTAAKQLSLTAKIPGKRVSKLVSLLNEHGLLVPLVHSVFKQSYCRPSVAAKTLGVGRTALAKWKQHGVNLASVEKRFLSNAIHQSGGNMQDLMRITRWGDQRIYLTARKHDLAVPGAPRLLKAGDIPLNLFMRLFLETGRFTQTARLLGTTETNLLGFVRRKGITSLALREERLIGAAMQSGCVTNRMAKLIGTRRESLFKSLEQGVYPRLRWFMRQWAVSVLKKHGGDISAAAKAENSTVFSIRSIVNREKLSLKNLDAVPLQTSTALIRRGKKRRPQKKRSSQMVRFKGGKLDIEMHDIWTRTHLEAMRSKVDGLKKTILETHPDRQVEGTADHGKQILAAIGNLTKARAALARFIEIEVRFRRDHELPLIDELNARKNGPAEKS